jgi:hypothetical protein
LPDASTFAHTDVGVGAKSEYGVAMEVSSVAAAISAFLGDCLESFCVELPDISDASTVASPDYAGGGVADGDTVEVSGGQAD